jgi:Skp family chaperone for outer membrane proteins
MKTLTKSLLAAAALTAAPLAMSTAAQAQVAYSDVEAVIGQSQAAKTASTQMQTTYKPQFDAIESRSKVLQAELNAMVVRYQADAKANPANPTLATQGKAIEAKQAAAEDEINKLRAPVARVQQYVLEQIDTRLDAAVTAAMAKKRITLLISRQAVIKNTPGTDLTPDIVAELNALLPSVSITPPAGWQPGQNRPGAAPAAPGAPATPPKPAPSGR